MADTQCLGVSISRDINPARANRRNLDGLSLIGLPGLKSSVKRFDPFHPLFPRFPPTHEELQHRSRQVDPKLPKQAPFHKCIFWMLVHNRHDGSAVSHQLMLQTHLPWGLFGIRSAVSAEVSATSVARLCLVHPYFWLSCNLDCLGWRKEVECKTTSNKSMHGKDPNGVFTVIHLKHDS